MKRYFFEGLIFLIQILMFYVFPLTAGPEDTMGMIVIIVCVTFVLSVLLALISDKQLRFWYPALIAGSFIPSVFIYYNDSAFIHAGWYFVVSMVGMLIGTVIKLLVRR